MDADTSVPWRTARRAWWLGLGALFALVGFVVLATESPQVAWLPFAMAAGCVGRLVSRRVHFSSALATAGVLAAFVPTCATSVSSGSPVVTREVIANRYERPGGERLRPLEAWVLLSRDDGHREFVQSPELWGWFRDGAPREVLVTRRDGRLHRVEWVDGSSSVTFGKVPGHLEIAGVLLLVALGALLVEGAADFAALIPRRAPPVSRSTWAWLTALCAAIALAMSFSELRLVAPLPVVVGGWAFLVFIRVIDEGQVGALLLAATVSLLPGLAIGYVDLSLEPIEITGGLVSRRLTIGSGSRPHPAEVAVVSEPDASSGEIVRSRSLLDHTTREPRAVTVYRTPILNQLTAIAIDGVRVDVPPRNDPRITLALAVAALGGAAGQFAWARRERWLWAT